MYSTQKCATSLFLYIIQIHPTSYAILSISTTTTAILYALFYIPKKSERENIPLVLLIFRVHWIPQNSPSRLQPERNTAQIIHPSLLKSWKKKRGDKSWEEKLGCRTTARLSARSDNFYFFLFFRRLALQSLKSTDHHREISSHGYSQKKHITLFFCAQQRWKKVNGREIKRTTVSMINDWSQTRDSPKIYAKGLLHAFTYLNIHGSVCLNPRKFEL